MGSLPRKSPCPGQSVRASWQTLTVIVLWATFGGCRALPDIDFNPLIRIEQRLDGSTEIEALGPLIAVRSGPEGLSHALRPLYQHKANFGLPVTDFLAPFGRHYAVEDGTRWRFWPLVWSGETQRGPLGSRWNAVVFPIIYAGLGPEHNDSYFAFLPLAGRTHDIFGIDTFDFFLWPLFMRTHFEVTETSDSWTVLLLGGWTDGGPRDGSWRALPFYRHRIVRDTRGNPRTDQRSAPWPFFTWGDDYQDTTSPSTRWALWPLASHESSRSWSRSTWLWPFFRANHETDPLPDEGGDFLYDLPWPLFRWSREGDTSLLRVFPFYSHFVSPQLDSKVWLIPFIWWRTSQGRTLDEGGWPATRYEREDFYAVPFWHNSKRTVDGRAGADTQRQLWPLFHSDHGADGRIDQAAPSLVPVRHFEFFRPVDELYSPFWTLWRRRSDGTRFETRLLFDTTLIRHENDGLRVSAPLLYSRRPEPEGVAQHNILWGLFGGRTDSTGWKSFSVLGFDLWAR
ncbi:MAG: hypothetical protein ACI9EF_003733 [Pseudohongiellaceae bacterium]|jgi:hypothetical protein